MGAIGYGVSFGSDENLLELVIMVTQYSEYTETTELYTSKGRITVCEISQ